MRFRPPRPAIKNLRATEGIRSNTVTAGQTTYGHRFLAPAPIKVRRFDDYVQALEKAKVVLDLDRRKDIIKADAEHLAFAQGLTLIEDEGLLEEVAGLVLFLLSDEGRYMTGAELAIDGGSSL